MFYNSPSVSDKVYYIPRGTFSLFWWSKTPFVNFLWRLVLRVFRNFNHKLALSFSLMVWFLKLVNKYKESCIPENQSHHLPWPFLEQMKRGVFIAFDQASENDARTMREHSSCQIHYTEFISICGQLPLIHHLCWQWQDVFKTLPSFRKFSFRLFLLLIKLDCGH